MTWSFMKILLSYYEEITCCYYYNSVLLYFPDEVYSHVMIWDADIKAQVRHMAFSINARKRTATSGSLSSGSGWKKVANTLRLLHAFKTH